MRSEQEFRSFFRCVTDNDPYPYQVRLASEPIQSRAMSVPTGGGKTAAAIVAWLWRLKTDAHNTPRRLVYCLPMRVLVEQTRDNAKKWTKAAHANAGLPEEIPVYTLMGGEVEEEWELHPERPAILVGTQDMLLSRALNRGYAMSRYQWPVHFGIVNSHCLWVCDEIQLMSSGLATSTQLQAWRENFGAYGAHATWWMSATFNAEWLETVDFLERARTLQVVLLGEEERRQPWYRAAKPLRRSEWLSDEDLGKLVLKEHQRNALTLVVVNTVDRAQKIFDEMQRQLTKRKAGNPEMLLTHSRFRGRERAHKERLLQEPMGEDGRVVIATQVVEAGVDISACTLVTELAPWASLVQRFGRCNRKGEFGEGTPVKAIVVDVKKSDPYENRDIEDARARLEELSNVAAPELENVGVPQRDPPLNVIRRKDLLQLFDTTPDLSGADLDISRFIREGEDLDVQVYWRAVQENGPTDEEPATREELCPVPVGSLKKFLDTKRQAFRWDPLGDRWVNARSPIPGQLFLIPAAEGGYSELGWDLKSQAAVKPLPIPQETADAFDRDKWSRGPWRTIASHTDNVCAELRRILAEVSLNECERRVLEVAARWHDRGKGHAVFQSALPCDEMHPPGEWAKANGNFRKYRRKRFRHELASALAVLQEHDGLIPDESRSLVAYLIAAHHGKVRLSIRSMPEERVPEEPGRLFARGIWDGDAMPALDLGNGVTAPAVTLNLECMQLGLSPDTKPSWAEQVLELRDRTELGVFRLGYLEAVLRAADREASRKEGDCA